MKPKDEVQRALLTRTEIEWLRNNIQLSNGYRRKIRSDIRRKLRIFTEFELPLLTESGLIPATTNCNIVTLNCNTNYPLNSSNTDNCSQNMVGWKGWI